MKINGKPYRTIWRELGTGHGQVRIIDQTRLPFEFIVLDLDRVEDAAHAISSMQVRGAPLIGATAAYGMCLALAEDASDEAFHKAYKLLHATRPTAINLKWALDEMAAAVLGTAPAERVTAAYARADRLCEEDVETCMAIGDVGAALIEKIAAQKDEPVNILTHCNAGWLATVDWGTALAPIYRAFNKGIPLHVWVDETRPRNQGASLTAWELNAHGVPHTVIADNTGGHLMQHGMVDLCIVGTDRTCANGDVCNKIGTYLKALAAHDNGVPFYVALPHSTIDWTLTEGAQIPIEQRSAREVTHIVGLTEDGRVITTRIVSPDSEAANYAFDVTPAGLVTGLMTERGLAEASTQGLLKLYPEKAA